MENYCVKIISKTEPVCYLACGKGSIRPETAFEYLKVIWINVFKYFNETLLSISKKKHKIHSISPAQHHLISKKSWQSKKCTNIQQETNYPILEDYQTKYK